MPIEKPRSLADRILFFLQSKNLPDGLELFYQNYSAENPPPVEFFIRFIDGLRALRAREQAYEALQKVSEWLPDEPELKKLQADLQREYYDALVDKGKKQFEQTTIRSKEFSEHTLTKVDVMAREKLEEENRNTLRTLYQHALDDFQRALEINPIGLAALNGAFRCYLALGDSTKAQEIETRILELTQAEDKKKEEEAKRLEEQLRAREAAKAPPPEEQIVDLPTLKRWYEQQRYHDVLRGLKKYLAKHPSVITGYLLGAKSHLELHEFHQAEMFLERALKIDPYFEETVQFKLDYLEKKYLILSRAATEYLNKGIQLGPAIGRLFFEKAITCAEKALEISPDELILLDQLFTCKMYLRQNEDAGKIRQQILLISPNFVTTWERSDEQSWCFIASYAYAETPELVNSFREFRRRFLLPYLAGRLLNGLYIRISPLLVLLARRSRISGNTVRFFLEPLRQLLDGLISSRAA